MHCKVAGQWAYSKNTKNWKRWGSWPPPAPMVAQPLNCICCKILYCHATSKCSSDTKSYLKDKHFGFHIDIFWLGLNIFKSHFWYLMERGVPLDSPLNMFSTFLDKNLQNNWGHLLINTIGLFKFYLYKVEIIFSPEFSILGAFPEMIVGLTYIDRYHFHTLSSHI